ncbi:MAG TPA: RHS repeat-associated core domain-containing protein, partial [Verrucomicrobiae bacterium]|nr:RHS repeat-associated core domain-containing protein [Verrucomicrobiae bacterium]
MLQALTAVLLLAMAPLSRARWYDVSSGRFFTMDAYQGDIENPAGLHKYMYVWDNPVNMVDPTGKWATFIHKMAVKRTLTGLLPDSDLEILCDMQT